MQIMLSTNDVCKWVVSLVAVLSVIVWLLWPFIRRVLLWWTTVNSIPGQNIMQIIQLHLQLLSIKDIQDIHNVARTTITPFFKRYPLLRLWVGPIPCVILFKAESVKVLLNSSSQIDKSPVPYRQLRKWFGDGLAISTGTKWQQRRKLIAPAFHFGILEDFQLVMNEQANILVQIIDKKCQEMKGNGFKIYPFISRASLDIICGTAMGQGVNAQMDHDSEYCKAADRIAELLSMRSVRPWLYLDCIYRRTSLGKLEQHGLNIINGFVNNVIKTKRTKLIESKQSETSTSDNGSDDVMGKKRRLALLDLLLEQSMEGLSTGGEPLTDEDIRDEVTTFILAGHETMSTTIAHVIFHVSIHPHVRKRITEELEEVYGDSNRQSTSNDLSNLKYLECVIKETLRFNPAIPVIGRQLNDNMNICGYTILAGMMVFVSTYYTHRDPAQFDNPDIFNPDRFLPENSQDRDPNAFIPFSAGPRNCIGQKYAMMEIKVILSAILRRFKVIGSDPDLSTDLFNNIVPKATCGHLIRLEPR